MAVKRIADINSKGATACLRCGRDMPPEAMKDGIIYKCPACGKGHFVDRNGSKLILTAEDRADMRRRIEKPKEPDELPEKKRIAAAVTPDKKDEKIKKLQAELRKAQKELQNARKDAAEWEAAAEGLARMIEEIKQKELDAAQAAEAAGENTPE